MNTILVKLGISSELIAARGLRECEEAATLELAEVGADGRNHLLVPSAAEAWRNLKAAALVDGVDLYAVSAYRSIERQVQIVRGKLEAGDAIENILAVCAPPGFSEHHTGRAIDVSTPGSRTLDIEPSTRLLPMPGSLRGLPNLATISLIPWAIRWAINMSLGIGAFGND